MSKYIFSRGKLAYGAIGALLAAMLLVTGCSNKAASDLESPVSEQGFVGPVGGPPVDGIGIPAVGVEVPVPAPVVAWDCLQVMARTSPVRPEDEQFLDDWFFSCYNIDDEGRQTTPAFSAQSGPDGNALVCLPIYMLSLPLVCQAYNNAFPLKHHRLRHEEKKHEQEHEHKHKNKHHRDDDDFDFDGDEVDMIGDLDSCDDCGGCNDCGDDENHDGKHRCDKNHDGKKHEDKDDCCNHRHNEKGQCLFFEIFIPAYCYDQAPWLLGPLENAVWKYYRGAARHRGEAWNPSQVDCGTWLTNLQLTILTDKVQEELQDMFARRKDRDHHFKQKALIEAFQRNQFILTPTRPPICMAEWRHDGGSMQRTDEIHCKDHHEKKHHKKHRHHRDDDEFDHDDDHDFDGPGGPGAMDDADTESLMGSRDGDRRHDEDDRDHDDDDDDDDDDDIREFPNPDDCRNFVVDDAVQPWRRGTNSPLEFDPVIVDLKKGIVKDICGVKISKERKIKVNGKKFRSEKNFILDDENFEGVISTKRNVSPQIDLQVFNTRLGNGREMSSDVYQQACAVTSILEFTNTDDDEQDLHEGTGITLKHLFGDHAQAKVYLTSDGDRLVDPNDTWAIFYSTHRHSENCDRDCNCKCDCVHREKDRDHDDRHHGKCDRKCDHKHHHGDRHHGDDEDDFVPRSFDEDDDWVAEGDHDGHHHHDKHKRHDKHHNDKDRHDKDHDKDHDHARVEDDVNLQHDTCNEVNICDKVGQNTVAIAVELLGHRQEDFRDVLEMRFSEHDSTLFLGLRADFELNEDEVDGERAFLAYTISVWDGRCGRAQEIMRDNISACYEAADVWAREFFVTRDFQLIKDGCCFDERCKDRCEVKRLINPLEAAEFAVRSQCFSNSRSNGRWRTDDSGYWSINTDHGVTGNVIVNPGWLGPNLPFEIFIQKFDEAVFKGPRTIAWTDCFGQLMVPVPTLVEGDRILLRSQFSCCDDYDLVIPCVPDFTGFAGAPGVPYVPVTLGPPLLPPPGPIGPVGVGLPGPGPVGCPGQGCVDGIGPVGGVGVGVGVAPAVGVGIGAVSGVGVAGAPAAAVPGAGAVGAAAPAVGMSGGPMTTSGTPVAPARSGAAKEGNGSAAASTQPASNNE